MSLQIVKMPSRRWQQRILLVVAIVPIVTAAARAIRNGWFPIGDNALLYVRVADVFTGHHPWLGSWTSASQSVGVNLNNPGPIYQDLMAVFAKVFSPGPGTAIGVGTLNICSIVAVSAVSGRLGGWRAQRWALLACAALSWSMGSELLIDLWQPHSLMLPFVLFLVLVVGVADGRTWCIPWALAVMSVLVQTHIGYAYILAMLCPVAAVSYWLERRRRPHATMRVALTSRPALTSAVVLAVIWFQPVYEQFFGPGPGNLGRLVTNASGGSLQVGSRAAVGIGARLFALPPWWGRSGFATSVPGTRPGGTPEHPTFSIPSLPGPALSAALLVVLVAVLIGLVVFHRRRGSHVLASVSLIAVAGVVGSVVAVSKLTVGQVGMSSHHVRFMWPLSILVQVAILASIGWWVERRWSARPRVTTAVDWCPALATVLVAALAVPYFAQPVGPVGFYSSMPVIARVKASLHKLAAVQPVVFETANLRVFEPYSATVMMWLQEFDIEFRVTDDAMVRQLGEGRRANGTEPATLFQLEGIAAVAYDGPACPIALSSAVTVAEQDGALATIDAVADQLAGGQILVNDEVLVDASAESVADLDAARAGDVAAARALVVRADLLRWVVAGGVEGPAALGEQLAAVDRFVGSAYGLFSDQRAPCA